MAEAGIPFLREDTVAYGVAERKTPLIARLMARNPGPYTYHGTGVYLIGTDDIAVIDPGPASDTHLDALLDAIEGKRLRSILVTHTHLDHSPAARPLAEKTGAMVLAFGPHGSGRGAGLENERVEEGGDHAFTPDRRIADGHRIKGAGWTLRAIHTPGHTSNHLCFLLEETGDLFTGDHIMSWATSVIAPPDGDMAAYMNSLKTVGRLAPKRLWPTHGPPIDAPGPFIAAVIRHRQERERQILDCLEAGVGRIPDIVERLYRHVPPVLHPAAARSVLAHLIALGDRGAVGADPRPHMDARFRKL